MFNRFLQPIILCYHQISTDRLCSHVQFLKKHFEVVSLKELLAETFERTGRGNSRLVSLTMDDCYEQDFANAMEVCEKEQVHCTFFLPVGYALQAKCFWAQRLKVLFAELTFDFVDEKGHLHRLVSTREKDNLLRHYLTVYNKNELQTDAIERMLDKLFEHNQIIEKKVNPILSMSTARQSISERVSFESHSMTHPKLYRCSVSQVAEELAISKKNIREILGSESRLFCYPYGSERHIGDSWKQVEKYYDYGFTLKRGKVNRRSNPMMLPRVDLYEQDNLLRMAAKILSAV